MSLKKCEECRQAAIKFGLRLRGFAAAHGVLACAKRVFGSGEQSGRNSQKACIGMRACRYAAEKYEVSMMMFWGIFEELRMDDIIITDDL
jgi:hypothetical protein